MRLEVTYATALHFFSAVLNVNEMTEAAAVALDHEMEATHTLGWKSNKRGPGLLAMNATHPVSDQCVF